MIFTNDMKAEMEEQLREQEPDNDQSASLGFRIWGSASELKTGRGPLLPPATNRLCFIDVSPVVPVEARPSMLGLVRLETTMDEASEALFGKAGLPTVPAPPPAELHLGTAVYHLTDNSLMGRVCGLSDRWYDVLWSDGYRNRYTRSELVRVLDVLGEP